ncbi:MAG TPA: DUF3524 domain-containing protein [Anaerolineae bacterium]|nr:DUF3524 domain-containing protein [Anaerolineae bacterium]
MKIWLIEPYLTGSHQAWAEGYRAHSRHQVRLLSLPGRFWKWRMQGGSITLARRAASLGEPDLLLASDMLNLPVFLALSGPQLARVPVALFFHENQLTYPMPPGEKRDLHYGFINLASALRADALFFNSNFHRDEFFSELPRLLKHFPDYNELWVVEALRARARVLALGLDLARLDAGRPPEPNTGRPTILWNHRWEYDKDPPAFFRAIYALAGEGLDFGLVLLGESFRNLPGEFLQARQLLGDRILHFGYVQDPANYAGWLWRSDIVVSTAIHEFFGAAVVEACYCGCFPILPRRLSYPELLPEELHATCLYDTHEALVSQLRQAILGVTALRSGRMPAFAEHFDWRYMAPGYDACLADVRALSDRLVCQ